MKVINKYECVVILNSKLEEEATQGLIEKFKAIIETEGTIDSIDEWGKRRLAYEIDDMTEGYYVLYNFASEGTLITELERVLKITDGVLRSMVIKKDEDPTIIVD